MDDRTRAHRRDRSSARVRARHSAERTDAPVAVNRRNAATLVDAPRTVAHEIQPLTPEQAQALLKVAQGQSLDGLVTVALSCGLRRGEMLGLQWPMSILRLERCRFGALLQRFGGDGATRRPLLAEQRRLRNELAGELTAEQREVSVQQLAAVGEALKAINTSLQVVEPKSGRSRRTIAWQWL